MKFRKWLQLFGLVVAASYILIFLAIWIQAELEGYTYFAAGEPNRVILYTEWILGSIALLSIADSYMISVRSSFEKRVVGMRMGKETTQ